MSYRGIADAVAARIRAGEWRVGERIPTTNQIAEEYGVGEATAYRALSILVYQGLLVGESGRGRFVAPGAVTE